MIELVSSKFEEIHSDFIVKHNVKFIKEPKFNQYDCQINWHNGSLVFNKEEIIKRIEKLF